MLWKELSKIFGQLRGSQNIFGYKSTVANQLFLLYCFSGKIYFTDEIDNWVKYLWYLFVSIEVFVTYSIGLAYLWCDVRIDLMTFLNVLNMIGACNMTVFVYPLLSYLYSNEIEAMIKHVDGILATDGDSADARIKQQQIIVQTKKVFRQILGSLVVCNLVNMCVTIFDLMLFFEEGKAENYLYYALPVPACMVEEYTSFGWFFIFNVISSFVFELYMIELGSVLAMMLYWNTICRHELICIKNDLRSWSQKLNGHVERCGARIPKSWSRKFERYLEIGIDRFRKVTVLINYLRGFVAMTGSLIIPTALFYGVAVLHVCTSANLSLVLKLKYLGSYLTTGFVVFHFYWIGDHLESSLSEVSLAVYSTPWFWSVRVRKNTYLLLCQTQSVKNFAIIKVHRLLFSNFSRYLHAVFSYTNVLRKLSTK